MIIGSPGYFILLKGYLRSFLFMRDAPSDAQILIWQPAQDLTIQRSGARTEVTAGWLNAVKSLPAPTSENSALLSPQSKLICGDAGQRRIAFPNVRGTAPLYGPLAAI
jgi:hypothetical protein